MANLVSIFRKWLQHAAPGAEFPYHFGLLARDRLSPAMRPVRSVDEIADEVLSAELSGHVVLVQRRLSNTALLSGRPLKEQGCLYLAVRTSLKTPR